ncbi:MAG: DEAD/DEAH box helicase, partial [Luteimonas sp.]
MAVRPRKRRKSAPLEDWFAAQGWRPAPFQREAWRRYLAGESGLLITPTGSGKTLAALGGPLLQALALGDKAAKAQRGITAPPRLRLLWITPLRALAVDTVRAMREPIEALAVPWTVAMRTGDASARDKRLARKGLSDVLVTTPESFALMLSYPDAPHLLAGLRGVVVDEWHELLGNKRGVLLQLCLARLRGIVPNAPIWGLSATLGNLEEARDVLLPHVRDAAILSSPRRRRMTLQTLLPSEGERFPWAGHLGLSQLQRVADVLQQARTSLLFTNTRSQAELWHRALQAVWLDDKKTLALHHGSLDTSLRLAAEAGLRDGSVRCVVATSSLDLGVDFPAVDQVLQVGSPKGMARLWQRGGRAKHRPGEE